MNIKCDTTVCSAWRDNQCMLYKKGDICVCMDYHYSPTNADRINSMAIDEKAEFLSKIAYARETPWSKPFAEKFCKSCPEPEYTLEDGSKMRLHECDFSDGVCPHGGDIVWWLKQTAEEDDHASL